MKSTDGGISWKQIDSGLTGSPSQTFAIDPQNPRTLYLGEGITYPDGSTKGGMFKSVDGGATWANAGLLNIPVL